jgi:hypothetical protein
VLFFAVDFFAVDFRAPVLRRAVLFLAVDFFAVDRFRAVLFLAIAIRPPPFGLPQDAKRFRRRRSRSLIPPQTP